MPRLVQPLRSFLRRARLVPHLPPSEFENKYFTQMCGGSKAGSYPRLMYYSILGLRFMKKERKEEIAGSQQLQEALCAKEAALAKAREATEELTEARQVGSLSTSERI